MTASSSKPQQTDQISAKTAGQRTNAAQRDRLERLEATRDLLAGVLEGTHARYLANIAREYRMVLDAIAAASDTTKQKADAVDQLSARRAAKTSRRARRQA